MPARGVALAMPGLRAPKKITGLLSQPGDQDRPLPLLEGLRAQICGSSLSISLSQPRIVERFNWYLFDLVNEVKMR